MTTSKTHHTDDSGTTSPQDGLGMLLGLGLQLALSWVLFIGGGVWLDRRRGGGWAFTVLGCFLGVLVGGYEFWKIVRQGSDPSGGEPPGASPKKRENRP